MPPLWWAYSIAIHILFLFVTIVALRLGQTPLVFLTVGIWAALLGADVWDFIKRKLHAEDERLIGLTGHGRHPGERARHPVVVFALLVPAVFFAGRAFGLNLGKAAAFYNENCSLGWSEYEEPILVRKFGGGWEKRKVARGLSVNCRLGQSRSLAGIP